MRASLRDKAKPIEGLLDIAVRSEPVPLVSIQENPQALQRVKGRVDVNIPDTVLDVIRSIRVFEISYQQQKSSDGSCNTGGTVHLGSYGAQGDYSRRRSSVTAIPPSSEIAVPTDCHLYAYRSVFVEWRDYEGSYDHEEVRY